MSFCPGNGGEAIKCNFLNEHDLFKGKRRLSSFEAGQIMCCRLRSSQMFTETECLLKKKNFVYWHNKTQLF